MPRALLARPRTILVADRIASPLQSLFAQLGSDAGYVVEVAACAKSVLAQATAPGTPLDAIVLATGLPDADGAELCARLRQHGVHAPILLMAEQAGEADIVRGLDAGANDFIIAPFRTAETLARLRAQIRAHESSEDAVLMIGPFQFRPARRMLQNRHTNERIRLTEKEASVLKFLYRAEGPVPRSMLLHEVWGYNAGATTHTVETHIYRLRRKIEPDPTRICLLINEEGGYRLRSETTAIPHWNADLTRFGTLEAQMASA
jgi:DNA-binding response OmpR family regulator